MSTVKQYAKSIAATAADYRKDDLGPFTADHVMIWVDQFDGDNQLPMLAEIDHVLKETYFSETRVMRFLEDLTRNPELTKGDPATFWRTAEVLDIQQGGNSQKEMLARFSAVLEGKLRVSMNESPGGKIFVYLDDASFTGIRIKNDVVPWIKAEAPAKAHLHIIVSALHSGGQYYAQEQLRKAADGAGKKLDTSWWRVREIESRKSYRDTSETFWPAEIPQDDDAVAEYIAMLTAANYPPILRTKGRTPKNGVFSGEEGRSVLERVFLKAGVRIRSMCPFLKETARPLGYSKLMTLGFGATVVTYRNCPNDCPLALWAGDPWYPLFRRKTN